MILPELLAQAGESLLYGPVPALSHLAERAKVWRLAPSVQAGTPELAWFGVAPDRWLAEGPLTVAALGADPPARSVQFHVSLLSCDESGIVMPLGRVPTPAQIRDIVAAASRLNTKRLTFVAGESADHGLVWEDGSLDIGVLTKFELMGRLLEESLPEGDGERMLRQWIGDSVNVLGELELNRVRMEEGLAPANLLWPWGPGFREPLPNLALRRGEPAWIISRSQRARGLARLFGYRSHDPALLGNGFNFSPQALCAAWMERSPSVTVLDAFERARAARKLDEAEWLLHVLDRDTLGPLLDATQEARVRVTLLAPGADGGLGLEYDSAVPTQNPIPFDERAWDDPRLQTLTLFESVAEGLR